MDQVARYRDRGGLDVTVDDSRALFLYDDAVDAFAAGRSCVSLLEQCLERVPLFALGRACEALVTGGLPRWSGWPPAAAGLTRRERQHLEIVADLIVGNVERAGDLAHEHLAEFPSDRLIAAAFSHVQHWSERHSLDDGSGRPPRNPDSSVSDHPAGRRAERPRESAGPTGGGIS